MATRIDRTLLSDAQWQRIEPLCAGRKGDVGRTGDDNRRFIEAVLWIERTGAPWRSLPPRFGKWNTVFQRFRRWTKKGVFKRMFEELSSDPNFQEWRIDGASGKQRTGKQKAPKSRSGRVAD